MFRLFLFIFLILIGQNLTIVRASQNVNYKTKIAQYVRNGDLQNVTKMLKKNRKLVNTKDLFGSSLLHIATLTGNTKMVELLLDYDANQVPDKGGAYPSHIASRKCLVKVMIMLIGKENTINIKDKFNTTPFQRAVQASCDSIVEISLFYKPDCMDLLRMNTKNLEKETTKTLDEYKETNCK